MLRYLGEYGDKDGEDKMTSVIQMQIGTEGSVQTAVVEAAPKTRLIMIYKGDMRLAGSMDKLCVVKVVGRTLMRLIPGLEIFDGDCIMALAAPAYDGDEEWMYRNVFKKLYMVDLKSDKAIDKVVDKAVGLYESAEDHEGKAGLAILMRYLNKQLMKFDVWEA